MIIWIEYAKQTRDWLKYLYFIPPKNIRLQPVPPPTPLEALLIPDNLTDSDSDGIGGGTGCNFIFFYLFMYLFISLCSLP